MNSAAKDSLLRLSGELTLLSQDLEEPPDTLEHLKFVLQKISDIKDISVEVEMQYRDIQVVQGKPLNRDTSGVGILSRLSGYPD